MKAWLHGAWAMLVATLSEFGLIGIAALMAVESSFIPFPSEIVMIPAGYAAQKGELSLIGAIVAGIVGSLIGAYVNYGLAAMLGRPFLYRYGRYVLIDADKMRRVERYFERHGPISTFIGRLIPVVRQLISLPAGLARMNLLAFTAYTAAGAGLWVTILALLGYGFGATDAENHLGQVMLGLALLIILLIGAYVWRVRNAGEEPTPPQGIAEEG